MFHGTIMDSCWWWKSQSHDPMFWFDSAPQRGFPGPFRSQSV